MSFWKPDWTQAMRVGGDFEWQDSDIPDNRDMRDPEVLGHRLLKLRITANDTRSPLTVIYDDFLSE